MDSFALCILQFRCDVLQLEFLRVPAKEPWSRIEQAGAAPGRHSPSSICQRQFRMVTAWQWLARVGSLPCKARTLDYKLVRCTRLKHPSGVIETANKCKPGHWLKLQGCSDKIFSGAFGILASTAGACQALPSILQTRKLHDFRSIRAPGGCRFSKLHLRRGYALVASLLNLGVSLFS